MGKIGTKDVKVGGGSTPKTFIPGNHTCKINGVRLDRPPFAKSGEEMYSIIMDLETEPLGGTYEGFFIDKDDESKGRHLGQTGRVKSSQWPHKNSEWNGKKFTMVDEIIKFIKSICEEINSDWADKADGKYDTIEDMVKAFNDEAPFKDVFLDWCVGGQQTTNDEGYPQYYMHIPKWKRGEKQFALSGDAQLMTYDKVLHLIVKGEAAKTVSNFAAGSADKTWDETNDDDDDDPFAVSSNASDDDPFAAE
tara:strand:- start:608 stop:1357 length:750 start_codon:yes stop_codon:yes gene_type:complete